MTATAHPTADPTATANMTGTADGLVVDRRNMPCALDEGLGRRARIGLIVLGSDHTIEHEFRHMLRLPGVAFYESRIFNAPSINPTTLKAMEAGIAASTALIVPALDLDVVAYACTSGALMIGPENVHARIREARPGVACSTPMEAAAAGLRALEGRRVCLIAPYVDEVNRAMRAHLIALGFEVPVMGSWNVDDDSKVARISERSIGEAVVELGSHPQVDAVFVSCTSLRLAERVQALEDEIGKPVTSSNHALAWHCLRLAGYGEPVPGLGRLFRAPLP